MTAANTTVKEVPSFCYNCVAGPDLMTVRVENGVATRIDPLSRRFDPSTPVWAVSASRRSGSCRRPTTRIAC